MLLLMMMVAAAMMLIFMSKALLLQPCQFGSQGSLAFHSFDQLLTGQIIPGGGHHSCLSIMLTQQRHGSIQLRLRNGVSTGQDNGGSGFNLVVVELAKVLGVELDLACISNSYGVTQHHIGAGHFFHCTDHIR